MKPVAGMLYGTLDVLDRQLRDRHGALCGNVDDLELERTENGELQVTAILTGAGALAYRLGRRRLGTWLHEATRRLIESDTDRGRIPMERVMHQLLPQGSYGEDDVETLVQTITDQIMATVG